MPPLKGKSVHLIFADFLFIPHIHYHLDQLAKYIYTLYFSPQPVIRDYGIPDAGQPAVQFLISLFLVLQTAHQSSTDSGNLSRIQGEILLLCHFDGYWDKIRKITVTA